MPDHMVFLSCWLITYKLLYQFFCCWLLLTRVCFLLSIVFLFHIFSTSPEKMHLVFTLLIGLNCKGYLLQLNSVKKRYLPKKKLIEQKLCCTALKLEVQNIEHSHICIRIFSGCVKTM